MSHSNKCQLNKQNGNNLLYGIMKLNLTGSRDKRIYLKTGSWCTSPTFILFPFKPQQ